MWERRRRAMAMMAGGLIMVVAQGSAVANGRAGRAASACGNKRCSRAKVACRLKPWPRLTRLARALAFDPWNRFLDARQGMNRPHPAGIRGLGFMPVPSSKTQSRGAAPEATDAWAEVWLGQFHGLSRLSLPCRRRRPSDLLKAAGQGSLGLRPLRRDPGPRAAGLDSWRAPVGKPPFLACATPGFPTGHLGLMLFHGRRRAVRL